MIGLSSSAIAKPQGIDTVNIAGAIDREGLGKGGETETGRMYGNDIEG